MDLPQEGLGGLLHRLQVAEIEFKEVRFLLGLLLEPLDRHVRLLRVAPGDVDLGVMLKQRLQVNASDSFSRGTDVQTLAVHLPTPAYPPVTIATRPVRSGISSTLNVDLGGYIWEYELPMIVTEKWAKRCR
jgi:hypothetical protein